MSRYKMAFILLAGSLAFPAFAMAEMISGTITNIDPAANKITLLRADTRDSIVVSFKDQAALRSLHTGSNVTLNADKKMIGGWQAQAVDLNANAAVSAEKEAQANREAIVGQ